MWHVGCEHVTICMVNKAGLSAALPASCRRFLMFYEGKLVEATNNLRTAQEIKGLCLDALTRARRGMALPDGFSFSAGRDNQQLDSITPTWSPLVAAQAGVA